MKLRMKILSGFLILVVMLAVAGVYSIYELTSISASVQKLLDDNYKSIDAAKSMIEALEREDSGLLLVISGEHLKGREMLVKADAAFLEALDAAKKNLTIQNEYRIIEEIGRTYETYKGLWSEAGETDYDMTWYFDYGHTAFLSAKTPINELIALNDATMYSTASNLKNRIHRIIMPGIVAVLSALVFALVFNFFINHYFINPLISITKAVEKSLKTRNFANIEIETNDELKDLASAVNDLSGLVPKSK
jgi:HAMP domain-containing protein